MANSFLRNLAALFILLCSSSLISASEPASNGTAPAVHWGYGDIEGWKKASEVCATGKRQSPINIIVNDTVGDSDLAGDKLNFDTNYRGQLSGDFLNNGHTVQFTLSASGANEKRPRISGGGLGPKGYILEQFHFHWGNCSDNNRKECLGAEHQIDSKSAVAEVHFVHFNSKYPTFTEAVSHEDGLAVVGFLFEAVTDSKLVKTDYSPLAKLIGQITVQGNKTSANFDFGKLIPTSALDSTGIYYRYVGSLTTPPCSEVVTWTVFDYRIPILDSTLAEFRRVTLDEVNEKTHKSEQEPLFNNYRPVQALNTRIVKVNKPGAAVANRTLAGAEDPDAPIRTYKSAASNSIFNCAILAVSSLFAAFL